MAAEAPVSWVHGEEEEGEIRVQYLIWLKEWIVVCFQSSGFGFGGSACW